MAAPNRRRPTTAITLDAELYEWVLERLEHDRSMRSFSHACELGLELLREDLEAKDKAAKKRKR